MGILVQVCLAALHPVAVGAATTAVAQSSNLYSSRASSPIVRVDAVVSQGFTDEHGAGAAVVYAQYGSGSVADVTTSHHVAVVSLNESLVSVTGFTNDRFNLKVRISLQLCFHSLQNRSLCASKHLKQSSHLESSRFWIHRMAT